MAVPGLGQKSLEEIKARLAEKGWALTGEESEDGEELLGQSIGDGAGNEAETALLGGDSPIEEE